MPIRIILNPKGLNRALLLVVAAVSWLCSSVGFPREWVDDTGKFRLEAEYVSHRDGKVRMRRMDGKIVSVLLRRLSKADRDYVFSRAPNAARAEPPSESSEKSPLVPLLAVLISQPTAENYLAARSMLLCSDQYAPYSTDISELEQLYKQKQFSRVLKTVSDDENLWLSPWAHFRAYNAARALGRPTRAKREASLMGALLTGIEATGDGSRERPFVVTRISDEYDLMRSFGKVSSSQRLMSDRSGKYFDVLDCNDGTTMWFDITDIFRRKLNSHASNAE